MKVIYIVSQRRSGSTLIENLLGRHPDAISTGEFRLLKDHYHKRGPGKLWDWKCDCGEEVKQCPFWSKYYPVNAQNPDGADTALTYHLSLAERLGFMTGQHKGLLSRTRQKGIAIAKQTLKIYAEIIKGEKGSVIIDSSKDALQGYYLAIQSDDVTVVYLKRQLRATVASKYKRSKTVGKQVGLWNVLFGSFLNEILNKRLVDRLPDSQVVRLTYEGFIENKEEYYRQILEKAALTKQQAPEFFEPYPSHSIAGTPGRFEKQKIVYDSSWKKMYKNRHLLNLTAWFLEKWIGE